MKITKDILINHGIDPSLYNQNDLSEIESYVESIKDGKLSSLLEKLSECCPDENVYREKADEARSKAIDCIKELYSLLDVVYELCSSKQSVFSSSLSPEDTDRILVGSMNAFKRMFDVKNSVYDNLTEMFNFKQELSKIRDLYNRKLYCAGMINAAFAVACPDGDNSEIIEVSGQIFEKFNELTEFNNDANDRIIIIDDALNKKLSESWNEITYLLDFDGDGANLNTQKVKSEIEVAKQILKDVIER